MIHLTVAMPMGIDSVFFSFIQRLAFQNGHVCLDPPAQSLIDPGDDCWIEEMRCSNQHHFLIGYRYPPANWKLLADHASTVCLLADPDGISRQIEDICKRQMREGRDGGLIANLHSIRHALEATISLTDLILSSPNQRTSLLLPASAFFSNPHHAFSRLERFYDLAGVDVRTSCSESFSMEAVPLLNKLQSAHEPIRREIHRLLTLEDSTPSRLRSVMTLFAGER
jgi:hypothetical protein